MKKPFLTSLIVVFTLFSYDYLIASDNDDKLVVCFHGLGEVGQGNARAISSEVGIIPDQFELSKTMGLSFPVDDRTYHVFNPLASEVLKEDRTTWFPASISEFLYIIPRHSLRLFELAAHYGVFSTLQMLMQDPIHTFVTLLQEDPNFGPLFSDLVQDEAVKIKSYLDELLINKRLKPENLILSGVSQGGIMAHRVATLFDRPIHSLLMGIAFPFPGAQFKPDCLPTHIHLFNGSQDPLFPKTFVMNMLDRQTDEFKSRSILHMIEGVGHTIGEPEMKEIIIKALAQ